MELYIRNSSNILSQRLGVKAKIKQSRRGHKRSFFGSRKRLVRTGLVLSNALLLAVVVSLVVKSPNTNRALQSASSVLASGDQAGAPIDQLSSADIAVYIALEARLPEVQSVINHADSVSSQLATTSTESHIAAKPQVISAAFPSRKDIKTYQTKRGDTIGSVAEKFDVSSNSIRWSNDLLGDDLQAGLTLFIPPPGQNGIVYRVKAGDTPSKLASKFKANKELIIAFNDAEVSGLKPGERILIPNGRVEVAAAATTTYNYSGFAFGSTAMYGYNGYDFGWCTWWAAKRRADIGREVPGNLGDAYSWTSRAPLAGLSVSGSPSEGAVIWSNTYYPGHVGFVEKLNGDGSIWVTDMNSHGQASMTDPTPAGGWNQVSWRLVKPSEFGRFKFIN